MRKRKRVDLTPKVPVNPVIYEKRLEDLVTDYIATRNLPCMLKNISAFKSITDFVCGAVNDPTVPGYRKFNVDPNHHRHYNFKKAKKDVENFIHDLEVEKPVGSMNFKSFEELFEEVAARAEKVKYIGPVGVYDFSVRFGWTRPAFAGSPQIVPREYVYIHSKPLLSAILLFELDPSFPKFIRNEKVDYSFRIPYDAMNEVFKRNSMNAFMIEDFLCHFFEDIKEMYNDLSGNHIEKEDIKLDEKYLKNK